MIMRITNRNMTKSRIKNVVEQSIRQKFTKNKSKHLSEINIDKNRIRKFDLISNLYVTKLWSFYESWCSISIAHKTTVNSKD